MNATTTEKRYRWRLLGNNGTTKRGTLAVLGLPHSKRKLLEEHPTITRMEWHDANGFNSVERVG